MVTLHPCGFTHGPHPKALGKMLKQEKAGTDEYAVMVDARDALDVGKAATSVEWGDYHRSWQAKK
jgi:homogentisate 1,2-dioxygenase